MVGSGRHRGEPRSTRRHPIPPGQPVRPRGGPPHPEGCFGIFRGDALAALACADDEVPGPVSRPEGRDPIHQTPPSATRTPYSCCQRASLFPCKILEPRCSPSKKRELWRRRRVAALWKRAEARRRSGCLSPGDPSRSCVDLQSIIANGSRCSGLAAPSSPFQCGP